METESENVQKLLGSIELGEGNRFLTNTSILFNVKSSLNLVITHPNNLLHIKKQLLPCSELMKFEKHFSDQVCK